ncbi:hypothetical protein [Ekhidna sp.]|uniref:hypothetical protein n=1 Tax=Ekhidna sp. TaxID=2608089 RepID=UPI003B5AC8BE
MRDSLLVIVLFFSFIACSEEDLPEGLYDYQVERLLTGGSAKTWDQVVGSTNCTDSLKLYFELVNDSVDISQINPGSACAFDDTLFLGRANASGFPDNNLFTDSLNFSDGDYWMIRRITSSLLQIEVYNNTSDYRYVE